MEKVGPVVLAFVLFLSFAMLVSAIRMKVAPYDEPRTILASSRRMLKVLGIGLGVLGVIGALRGLAQMW